jgi:hypothetical protein
MGWFCRFVRRLGLCLGILGVCLNGSWAWAGGGGRARWHWLMRMEWIISLWPSGIGSKCSKMSWSRKGVLGKCPIACVSKSRKGKGFFEGQGGRSDWLRGKSLELEGSSKVINCFFGMTKYIYMNSMIVKNEMSLLVNGKFFKYWIDIGFIHAMLTWHFSIIL